MAFVDHYLGVGEGLIAVGPHARERRGPLRQPQPQRALGLARAAPRSSNSCSSVSAPRVVYGPVCLVQDQLAAAAHEDGDGLTHVFDWVNLDTLYTKLLNQES
jgi:hypothetical protein